MQSIFYVNTPHPLLFKECFAGKAATFGKASALLGKAPKQTLKVWRGFPEALEGVPGAGVAACPSVPQNSFEQHQSLAAWGEALGSGEALPPLALMPHVPGGKHVPLNMNTCSGIIIGQNCLVYVYIVLSAT